VSLLINPEDIQQRLLLRNHEKSFLKPEFLLLAAIVYELCHLVKTS